MEKTKIQELLTGHDFRYGTDEEKDRALKNFCRPLVQRLVVEMYAECGIHIEEVHIEGDKYGFGVKFDSHPGISGRERLSVATLCNCVMVEELCSVNAKVMFGPPDVLPPEVFARMPDLVEMYHDAVKSGSVGGMAEVLSGKVSTPEEVVDAMNNAMHGDKKASFKA